MPFSYSPGRSVPKAVNNYTDVLPGGVVMVWSRTPRCSGAGRTSSLAQYVANWQGLTLGAQFTEQQRPAEREPQRARRPRTAPGRKVLPKYALSANYDFNMGLSLGAATTTRQARPTSGPRT